MSEDTEERSLSEPTRELTTDTPISDLIPTEEADPELVAHLRQSIADLERELAESHRIHVADITTIGEVLIEEADEHELCSVYDSVIAGLNQKITVRLPQREVDVSVRVTGTVSFHFDRRVTLALPMGTTPNSAETRTRALGLLESLGVRAVGNSADPESVTYLIESTQF